jgi:hypothetical protein
VFPYSTAQLANAIKYFAERMEILKEMENLDSTEAPHCNEEELLVWSKNLLKR